MVTNIKVLAWLDRHSYTRWFVNLLVITALGGAGYWNFHETNKAERALCALRADHQSRLDRAKEYQREVAIGVRLPIPGITEADINRGIQDHHRTIHALSILDCGGKEHQH